VVRRRAVVWLLSLGIPALLIAVVAVLWGPGLLVALMEARASAALARPVSISRLHVAPGRFLRFTAEGVVVGNPPNWQGEPLARIPRVTLDLDLWAYIRHGQTIIPQVAIEKPLVVATQTETGDTNFGLQHADTANESIKFGVVRIAEGRVRISLARLQVDCQVDISTHDDGQEGQLVMDLDGTYAGQPIKGRMVGGALLSLRDASHPWPVDLRLQHGPTTVTLAGTLLDPTAMNGASLAVQLSGPDLSSLGTLTGLSLPKTAGFQLTGRLDLAGQRVQMRDLNGHLGNTDLAGTIEFDHGNERPKILAELASHRVDLADLGLTPGPEAAKAEAGERLLPTTPVVFPRLRSADVHLKFRGQRVQGKSVLLDNVDAALDIVDGQVTLHPITVGEDRGSIMGNMVLTPRDKVAHAKADIAFQQVDLLRLLTATSRSHGTGAISGTGSIDGTGSSLAQMLGSGNGWVRFGMVGGDVSGVMVHLFGAQKGNALLSALGLPNPTPVECLIGDLSLQKGVMTFQTLVVDTGEVTVIAVGRIDLGAEKLNLQLRSESRHFRIGSLPAPLNVTGTLKHPSVLPGSESADGLAAKFPPLALLPTIQFGTGEDHRCHALLGRAKQQPGGERLPDPQRRQTPR